jgi:adenylylsulfate kinase
MMKVTKTRSFVKALSYRIWGTLSSVAVAYVITKNASLSVTIAFWETVVKVFIYYAHERGWNKIQWGRK